MVWYGMVWYGMVWYYAPRTWGQGSCQGPNTSAGMKGTQGLPAQAALRRASSQSACKAQQGRQQALLHMSVTSRGLLLPPMTLQADTAPSADVPTHTMLTRGPCFFEFDSPTHNVLWHAACHWWPAQESN
jgi:hypothetical protein